MGHIAFNDEGKEVRVMYFQGLGRNRRHVRTAYVPKGDTAALTAEIDASLTALRTERSPVGKVDR